ncbi:MAG: FmdE family protein [bacterium]
MKNKFRMEIEQMIDNDDLPGLLKKGGELHGHYCNYLAYGVIAGLYGIKKLKVENTGMEEIIAIVETNNCFADGVQMVTGCSFANNALIYRDYGKTAVTITKRDGQATRLVLNPDYEDSREEEYPEAYQLFDKLVVKREPGTPEEYGRFMESFAQMSVEALNVPVNKIFNIFDLKIEIPAYAPIFDTVKCEVCGENLMKTRAVEKDGKFKCIPCSNSSFYELNGSGIVKITN